MERDIVWSSTRVNFRDFVVQYFHIRYVLLSLRTLILKIMLTTLRFCADKSAEFVINSFEQSPTILLEWLNNNYLKVNTGKSHLLLSVNSRATATIDNSYTESEDEIILLGITIDSNITFENQINGSCKKASQKFKAPARITPYMNIQKQRTVM